MRPEGTTSQVEPEPPLTRWQTWRQARKEERAAHRALRRNRRKPTFLQALRALFGLVFCSALAGLLVAVMVAPPMLAAGVGGREAIGWYQALPTGLPLDTPTPQHSRMYAADGTLIADLYSENRVPVDFDDLPQHLIDALTSTEDAKFWDNSGVDLRGLARAALSNAQGGAQQGASTITMQYVRLVLLNDAKTEEDKAAAADDTINRKIREIRYATELSNNVTKEDILVGYLNLAYFGEGAYGIGAAAGRYFSKPVNDLTVNESAMLVGLLKNPAGYDPLEHPNEAKNRRDTVLGRMRATGALTPAEADELMAQPVEVNPSMPANGCAKSQWPFYCSWIRNQLLTDPVFGETEAQRRENLRRGGLTIQTALDPRVQEAAQNAVDRFNGPDRVANGLAVVVPGSGRVAALAQNVPFGAGEGQTEISYPAMGRFQPGSTFKAFTIAAALEQGYPLDKVIDAPARYTPKNMDHPEGGYRNAGDGPGGVMNMVEATWYSTNTAFIMLEEEIGILPIVDTAERMGITGLPREGPRAITERSGALTLGVYETSPMELAAAYAGFAAQGVVCDPVGIVSIEGPTGPIPVKDGNCRQAISPDVANTVAQILAANVDGVDDRRTSRRASIGRPAAGKTGTANSFAASWFAGFTPNYSAAVWYGDPRGGQKYPLREINYAGQYFRPVYGGGGPALTWQSAMSKIHEGLPEANFPVPGARAVTGTTRVMPDMRGVPGDAAKQTLTDAGFTVTVETLAESPSYLLTSGGVWEQSPAPGAAIRPGVPVTLRVVP